MSCSSYCMVKFFSSYTVTFTVLFYRIEITLLHCRQKKRVSFMYLDLVAGGFVPLPVGPSLSSAMSPNHVLIQLLRDIQVCHPNQVAAMLWGERGRKHKQGKCRTENDESRDKKQDTGRDRCQRKPIFELGFRPFITGLQPSLTPENIMIWGFSYRSEQVSKRLLKELLWLNNRKKMYVFKNINITIGFCEKLLLFFSF